MDNKLSSNDASANAITDEPGNDARLRMIYEVSSDLVEYWNLQNGTVST